MPVRSLNSSVLKWPDREIVHQAAEVWACNILSESSQILRVGYFGSYARGDWGVGSDLDVVFVVNQADGPFEDRAATVDTTELPVPVDVLIYTTDEYEALTGQMREVLHKETIWLAERE